MYGISLFKTWFNYFEATRCSLAPVIDSCQSIHDIYVLCTIATEFALELQDKCLQFHGSTQCILALSMHGLRDFDQPFPQCTVDFLWSHTFKNCKLLIFPMYHSPIQQMLINYVSTMYIYIKKLFGEHEYGRLPASILLLPLASTVSSLLKVGRCISCSQFTYAFILS